MPRPSLPLMFAATTIGSASVVFVVTMLAAHIFLTDDDQSLAALVPVTHWISAIPCVFLAASLQRRGYPARAVTALYLCLAASSLALAIAGPSLLWLVPIVAVRGAADFLTKNSRARWIKAAMSASDQPQRIGSVMSSAQYCGSLLGGVVSILLIGQVDTRAALAADGVCCVLAAALAARAGDINGPRAAAASTSGAGWSSMFAVLRRNVSQFRQYVLLFALGGLFQGFHQAAKLGLSGHLAPLPAASVPGTVQVVAGCAIITGTLCAAAGWFYKSSLPMAGSFACACLCLLALPTLTAFRDPVLVLVVYALMLFAFEICFSIASNNLMIGMPPEHVHALHSSSYVCGYTAMSASAFATAWLFDHLGLERAIYALVAGSLLLYPLTGWLLYVALGRIDRKFATPAPESA